MIAGDLARRAARLSADRAPFVLATVVRARHPTSVRPGDSAIVLADGTIEGFVGGMCAASSVRLYAMRALETGESVLLRLVPDDVTEADELEGAVVEHNPCLSAAGAARDRGRFHTDRRRGCRARPGGGIRRCPWIGRRRKPGGGRRRVGRRFARLR